MEMPPPGWYEDPVATGTLLRWWDGMQWTEHTAPLVRAPDPAPASEAQAPIGPAPLAITAGGADGLPGYDGLSVTGDAHGNGQPPANSEGDPSLTDWFQSIPFPVITRDETTTGTGTPGTTLAVPQSRPGPGSGPEAGPSPGAGSGLAPGPGAGPGPGVGPGPYAPVDNSTRVLERDGTSWDQGPAASWDHGQPPAARPARGTGALARLGWRRSAPVSDDSLPILERGNTADMLRRNRTRLMWGVALGAALAMLITGVLVAVLGSAPAAHPAPAANAGHPAAAGTLAPSASATPSNAPSATATTGTPVTDAASGLSYAMLSTPWTAGCPAPMSNAMFTWTGGESAVAGTVPPGSSTPWYGSACSGLLGQQYAYTGVADLPQTAMNLVSAFDPTYYSGLPHVRSTQQNDPLQVSGHPAWIVEFHMTYPTAASLGLAWQAQLGAVVVVDRGTGQPPAVLYVTVPDNLGTANVGMILASLQLAAPPAAATPAAPVPPATAAPTAPPAAPAAAGATPGANP